MNHPSRVVSLQVGTPKRVDADPAWTTAFFKESVDGFIWLGTTNLDDDRQADLTVHGGPNKAVCVYPASHYAWWARELNRAVGGPGWFGENFTVSQLTETSVCIGDIYRVGTAIVQVSQPRGPCWKLAARWAQPDLPKRVVATGRSGWYLRVLEEGAVARDCLVTLESRPWAAWSIARVNEVTYARADAAKQDERLALLECAELAEEWRGRLAVAGEM